MSVSKEFAIRNLGKDTTQRPAAAPRPLLSAEELARRVGELAAEIDAAEAAPRQPGDPLLVVAVLKGAVYFAADLTRRLQVPLRLEFVQAASYGKGGSVRGELRLQGDAALELAGRDVLLVEDIVDSGHTVHALLDLLRCRGARSVRLCALLDKAAARQIAVPIDYRGFVIDDVFVVGYGLDHDERYRNLPYIAVWESANAATPRSQPT